MASYPFSASNVASDVPPASATSFTIASSSSETAINICRALRIPAGGEQDLIIDEAASLFNAPIVYKRIALPSFQSLRATLSISSTALHAQNQVGVVFVLPSACATEDGGDGGSREQVGRRGQWVKVYLVHESGETYVNTVVCDRWEDKSLVRVDRQIGTGGHEEVTIEMERDDNDASLWIYVLRGEERVPTRQVPWILNMGGNVEGISIKQEMREAWAGCYCARPSTSDGQSSLVAQVKDFELRVRAPEQMGMLV